MVILLIHLGSQPGGASPLENAAVIHSRSFHSISENPLSAPHDILSFVLSKVGAHLFWTRLSSVIWYLVWVAAFFSLARSMFGNVIGLVGAVIWAATPLFLIAGRQSSAEIMLAAPILIMAIHSRLGRPSSETSLALPSLIVFSALTLYIPGMVWWLAGAAIVGRKKLGEAFQSVPAPKLYISFIAGVVLAAPLVLAIALDWQLIKPLALVPGHWQSIVGELKNIGWMGSAWFVKTPFHSPLIIDRLPLFNIVQAALLVFGAYALFKAARNKAWALVAAMAFASVAAGLNDNISLLLLGFPAAGLFIATGLRYLYVEWRGVFPRNPAAKYLAIVLIALIGAVQMLFGIRYALVAWPDSVATRDTYVIK